MDISATLERENLFSYVQVRAIFDQDFSKHLDQSLSSSQTELVLNLCRISAAELAVLERSIMPLPFAADAPAIEILPRQAFFALTKTDTTVFFQCRAANVLPTKNNVGVTDFVLFTGDADKLSEYWNKHGVNLVENDNFADALHGLISKYQQAKLTHLPSPLDRLDGSATKALHWQMLLMRAKLDICIGSNSFEIETHIKHSKNLL